MTEEELFHRALEKPTLTEQLAFLDQACADNPELRQRLERLLRSHRHEDSFLNPPATTDEALSETPGTVIGPYKLLEQIGEGGMGTVWMAQQTEPIKRLVAVKLIKAGMDSRQVIARFEAERQALALMDHPNIAKVFDGGATGPNPKSESRNPKQIRISKSKIPNEEGPEVSSVGASDLGFVSDIRDSDFGTGRPYFVMELVKGIPITKYCDEHHLTPRERLELFIPVCHAVQHAHQKGIIHRDLKPSNVLVALYDGKPVPKVIDFGVAKAAGQPLTEQTLVTGFGAIVGTLEYMSPEQAEINQLDIDTRSDIYSLGVLLYELLTGSPPFSRKELEKAGMLEMLRVIREQEPSKPSTKLSSSDALPTLSANRGTEPAKLTKLVRGELDWIVMKALDKDRNRRYETANGFAMDVQRYLADEAVQACPPSVGYRLRKFARRNRGPVLAGVAITSLLVLGIICTSIGLLWALRAEHSATLSAETAARERHEAETQRDRARNAEVLATQRLHEVTREKERATEAESDTRAFSEFLVNDVLAVARPKGERGGLGIGVTVKEALDAAAANIAIRFRDRPRAEAFARHDLGVTYRLIGELDKSLEQFRRAYELRKKMFGADDARTVHTGNSLAVVYQVQGQFAEAEPYLVHALEVNRRLFGEEHHATLGVMNNLASLYEEQRRFDRAEPIYLRALDISRRVQGEVHPDTLRMKSNLGGMYTEQRRFAEAEPLCVEALEGRRRVRGEDHPDTLKSRYNLGRLYLMQGRYAKAESELVKTLEARRRVLGEGHFHTLLTMNILASLYREQRDFAKAEPLLVESLAVSRRVRGDRHPETLRTMNDLAVVYWSRKKLDRSIPLFEQLLKVRQARGPDSEDTLFAMANLGINYRDAGRLTEGIVLLEQACQRIGKRSGPLPPLLAALPLVLALTYDQAGQFAKAEPLYRAALEKTRQENGSSPAIAPALAQLGWNLLQQKRYADAEPLLRECLALRERHQPQTWGTFDSRSMLGGALLGQKKYAEAEPLLLAGCEGLKRREATIPPDSRARLTEALERLVECYIAWNKPDEADTWRKRLNAHKQKE